MSKQQRVIANFILEGGLQTTFLNAKQIASKTGVSQATVARFTQSLGYSSFKDFSDELQHLLIENYAPMRKLKESLGSDASGSEMLSLTCRYELENIQNLLNLQQDESFDKAIDLLLGANRILIVGARSTYAIVYYTGFLLRELVNNVHFLAAGSEMAYEQLEDLSEADVFIPISFHRYTKRTVELTAFAAKKGAKIVAITDGVGSPLQPYSHVSLSAPNSTPFYSYITPMVVINALVWTFASRKKEELEPDLEKRVKMLLDNNIFV